VRGSRQSAVRCLQAVEVISDALPFCPEGTAPCPITDAAIVSCFDYDTIMPATWMASRCQTLPA